MDDPLFNETETSECLRVAVKILQKWRWLGCGPEFIKQGARVFYRQSALEAYIEQQRRRSTSDRGQQ